MTRLGRCAAPAIVGRREGIRPFGSATLVLIGPGLAALRETAIFRTAAEEVQCPSPP